VRRSSAAARMLIRRSWAQARPSGCGASDKLSPDFSYLPRTARVGAAARTGHALGHKQSERWQRPFRRGRAIANAEEGNNSSFYELNFLQDAHVVGRTAEKGEKLRAGRCGGREGGRESTAVQLDPSLDSKGWLAVDSMYMYMLPRRSSAPCHSWIPRVAAVNWCESKVPSGRRASHGRSRAPEPQISQPPGVTRSGHPNSQPGQPQGQSLSVYPALA
jgi:hypothetical protein